jgi:hypothetical protein
LEIKAADCRTLKFDRLPMGAIQSDVQNEDVIATVTKRTSLRFNWLRACTLEERFEVQSKANLS